MMNNSFLSKWDKSTKYLFYFGILAFLVNVGLFTYHYNIGPEGHLDWLIVSETESIQVPIINFEKLFHSHTITGDAYVMYEKFAGTPQPVDIGASNIYLSFIVIAFSLGLTAITHARKQFIFIIGMLVIFFFLALLRIGELSILNLDGPFIVGGLCLIYGLIAYKFYAFGNSISGPIRFLIILATSIILVLTLGYLSEVPHPSLHITSAGQIPFVIASLFFIVLISFDILNGFFFLSTNSKSANPKSNFLNFVLISTLYLITLTLVFLKEIFVIDWELKMIDPFYLLTISSIVGIWSSRKRALRMSAYMPYKSGSAFIYIALGIICLSTFYYTFATFNDEFIKVFRQIVLYAHLFIGLTYFFYILVNFYPQIKKNLPAHLFEYDPTFLRLSFVRVAGLLLVVVMIQRTHLNIIDHWESGYYSLWGDLYKKQSDKYLELGKLSEAKDNREFAKIYYHNSYASYPYNHKTSYNLANLSAEDYNKSYKAEDYQEAVKYFDHMIQCDYATAHSFVNYSNFVWQHRHDLSEQREILQKGLSKLPQDGYLMNNYALTFRDLSAFRDSAAYYLDQANGITNSNFVPVTNRLAYNVQFGNGKTIANQNDLSYMPYQINKMAGYLKTIQNKKFEYKQEISKDSILGHEEFLYLNNYVLQHLGSLDTQKIKLSTFLNHESNQDLQKELVLLDAHIQLNRGEKFIGKYNLSFLEESSTDTEKPEYQKLLGLYTLKENDLKNSVKWYNSARELEKFKFKIDAQYYEAMINGRLGDKDKAKFLLSSIISLDTANIYPSARAMFVALESETNDSVKIQSDQEKLWYALFNAQNLDRPHVYAISTISDPDIKAKVIAEIIPDLIAVNRITDAENLLEYVPDELSDPTSVQELNYAQLCLLNIKEEADGMLKYLKQPDLGSNRSMYVPYFKARAYELKKDLKKAEINYIEALNSSSFDENTLVHGIRFLADKANKIDLAYDIVLNASLSSPESIVINKLYVYVAVKNLYFQLAESVLSDLQDLMDEKEYEAFEEEIEAFKQQRMLEEGMDYNYSAEDENIY